MSLAGYKSASESATSKTPSLVQGGVVAALSNGSSTNAESSSAMSSTMSPTASPSASSTTPAKSGGEMMNKTVTWGALAAGLLAALFTSQMV